MESSSLLQDMILAVLVLVWGRQIIAGDSVNKTFRLLLCLPKALTESSQRSLSAERKRERALSDAEALEFT